MKPNSVPPFSELIKDCQRSAVHLELRDTYEGYDDGGRFAEWKRAGGITPAFVEDFRPWMETVREAVGRGGGNAPGPHRVRAGHRLHPV